MITKKSIRISESSQEAVSDFSEKSDRQIRAVSHRIAQIGNEFGAFSDWYSSSLEEILRRNFGAEQTFFRVESRKGGESLHLFALGISGSQKNEVFVVTVKDCLENAAIEEFLETLRLFPKCFPLHKDKKLYVVIASKSVSSEQQTRVEALGLAVVQIIGDDYRLKSKKTFVPKDFRKSK